jgi:hypothetical protein
MSCCFWWSDLVRFGFPLVRDFGAIAVALDSTDKSSDHIRYVLACDSASGYPQAREVFDG